MFYINGFRIVVLLDKVVATQGSINLTFETLEDALEVLY